MNPLIVREQIPVYDRLIAFLTFVGRWPVAALDDRAAEEIDRLRRGRIRIGTVGLKIIYRARPRCATRGTPSKSRRLAARAPIIHPAFLFE
jgi:hypothetical protein